MKKAFITGIGGQDGSYLAEYLVDLGYEVHGIVRRNSTPENQSGRLDSILDKINTYYGDLLDQGGIERLLDQIQPDEIYNIGAQSHVRISFDIPQFTVQTNALGVLNILEAYRRSCPKAKFYQASSSEMFGLSVDEDNAQRESTPMNPVSPYGCSKVFGYNIVRNYRRAYGLHATNGILFNHESPRRGTNFVTNKVVKPGDWVVATGVTNSIRQMCEYVFGKLDLNYQDYVVQNPKYIRPEELPYLKGDSTKIRKELGWKPKYTFEMLMDEMIDHWMNVYNDKLILEQYHQ